MARKLGTRHGLLVGARSLGMALGIVVGVAAAAFGASSREFHSRTSIDFSRVVTNVCPFAITSRIVGDLDDLYRFDADGSLVEILETVQHLTITSSANGHSLTAIGTGGSSLTFGADGSVLGRIFGINSLLTIPGHGVVVLDVGFQMIRFDLGEVIVSAGQDRNQLEVYCAALA